LLGLTESTTLVAAPIQAYTKPAARSYALQMHEVPTFTRRTFVAPMVVAPAPAVAEAPRSTRTFSYAPGTTTAPVMRRAAPRRVPAYLLPKSDPRKYNGF
jgi:hypothetical protein